MSYCRKCGERLEADAEFCPKCDASVSAKVIKVKVVGEVAGEHQKRQPSTTGVWFTIIGVVAIIIGFWLKGQTIIQYEKISSFGYEISVPTGYISLEPFGWLFIAIGAAVAILGIWRWSTTFKI